MCPFVRSSVRQYANERHVYIYAYVRPAKDLVMGLSAYDQIFALRVDLKEITELSGVKKQAGAELYPKQAFHHDVTVPRICPESDQIFAKHQGLDPGHDLLVTPRSRSRHPRVC